MSSKYDEENWSTQSKYAWSPCVPHPLTHGCVVRLHHLRRSTYTFTCCRPIMDDAEIFSYNRRDRNRKRPSRIVGCTSFPQNHQFVPAAISSVNTWNRALYIVHFLRIVPNPKRHYPLFPQTYLKPSIFLIISEIIVHLGQFKQMRISFLLLWADKVY